MIAPRKMPSPGRINPRPLTTSVTGSKSAAAEAGAARSSAGIALHKRRRATPSNPLRKLGGWTGWKMAAMASDEQLISAIALAETMIKKFEGLRLKAYLDAAGKPTIGYGLTRIYGNRVRMGTTITVDEADDLLWAEILRTAEKVARRVTAPVTSAMLAALISFAFNVGINAISNSTLLRLLNAGDVAGAADQFLRWNKVTDPQTGQKIVISGLTRRRIAERELFLRDGVPS